jgi:RNA ligase
MQRSIAQVSPAPSPASFFEENVLERDERKCVICGDGAQVVHLIVDNRLWERGGFFPDNAVSLCEVHHLDAERTTLTCDALREAVGIRTVYLPEHLEADQAYDKWANPILPNGTRLRGELFFEDSVQRVLTEGNVLSLFTTHVKFPRTYHLPWSPGATLDDKRMGNSNPFKGKNVVVTVKMDGENTTFYRDYVHARSLTFTPHPSRDRVKSLWGRIAHDIPEGWRICGENLQAKHSIPYRNLADYFLVFSVWTDRNVCLSWSETVEWAALLGLKTVPVLYEGEGDCRFLKPLMRPTFEGDPMEGYVARLSSSFAYGAYRSLVGKYVREGHVTSTEHWMHSQLKMNSTKP